MADNNSTLVAQSNHESNDNSFNRRLGWLSFSDPGRDRSSAVVVSNIQDTTAGIGAGDLIRVDFTENEIGNGGLYIITFNDEYICYRFFQRFVSGELRVTENGSRTVVTADMLKKIKVVGRVKNIYRDSGPGLY